MCVKDGWYPERGEGCVLSRPSSRVENSLDLRTPHPNSEGAFSFLILKLRNCCYDERQLSVLLSFDRGFLLKFFFALPVFQSQKTKDKPDAPVNNSKQRV